jgi:hypothetical protein
MYRTLLALGIVLLVVPAVRADGLPPRGQKIVTLDNKITAEKEYPDYLFFTCTGGKGPRAKLTAVKFDPKTPVELKGAGRTGIGRSGALIAVPKDAEKNYDTEEKFHLAIKNRTVEGMIQTKRNLDSQIAIKDTDARTVVVYEFAVEKIDPKDGIVLNWKKDAEQKKDGEKKDPLDEDQEEAPGGTVSAPRGGMWVAGVAVTLAVMFGGFWLVGRTRRKV